MLSVGLDAGSRAIKLIILDTATGAVVAAATTDQGVHQQERAQALLQETLRAHGLPERLPGACIATGYARNLLPEATGTVTEITCHARGVAHLMPETKTVVEIGGQDSKVIRLDRSGRVHDFEMNDRCAAGTGRFLEVLASRLEVPLTDLGHLAGRCTEPCTISSMCVVFAETEIAGLLATGASVPNIIAGVQRAIASRIASLAGRHIAPPVVFTGGVARIDSMAAHLEAALGVPINVPPSPEYTGALGAALIARDRAAAIMAP